MSETKEFSVFLQTTSLLRPLFWAVSPFLLLDVSIGYVDCQYTGVCLSALLRVFDVNQCSILPRRAFFASGVDAGFTPAGPIRSTPPLRFGSISFVGARGCHSFTETNL